MDNTQLLQAIRGMIQEEIAPLKQELATLKSTMAAKDDIAALKSDMATKDDLARLEEKMELYGQVQQNDVYHLLQVTSKKIDGIREDMRSITEITGEHEIKIRTLTRRAV